MAVLNLTAVKTEETVLKDYLESNISDILADKINNGVRIEKDGKTLINKKDFTTFMNYAFEEAKKLAEKGARFACHGQDTVFAWAIHYFEEDSVIGVLYNEDGTEYKPPKPVVNKTVSKPVIPAPKKKTETSLFDFMGDTGTAEVPDTDGADVADESEDKDVDDGADGDDDGVDEDGDNTEDETDTECSDGFTRISAIEYMDRDGEIFASDKQPVPAEVKTVIPAEVEKLAVSVEAEKSPITIAPETLSKLFGDTLIVR